MKRWIYLSVIVIIIVAAGIFLGWYFRYRQTAPAAEQPTATESGATGGETPFTTTTGTIGAPSTASVTGETGISGVPIEFGVVAQNPVTDFYIDASNNTVIIEPTGKIVRLSRNKSEVLSEIAISDLATAAFSYDGKKVLASFGDRNDPQTSIFDIDKKAWQPLPTGLKEITWAPSGYGVAYLKENSGQSIFYTLDTASTKAAPREVFRTFLQDLAMQWPYAKKIIFQSRSNAQIGGNLFELDVDKKTITPILIGKTGLRDIWDKDANGGLVFYDGSLGLVNRDKNTLTRFGFSSLPSKCAFNTDVFVASSTPAATSTKKTLKTTEQKTVSHFLYCAVPQNPEFTQSRLPDDYEKGIVFSADNFVKINSATGGTETVFNDPSQKLDAAILKVFNKTLFFVNKIDQKLYAISLE